MRIHCVDECWLLWFSCQYLPSDWLERPLWGHLNVVRRLPPQSPGGRECLCIFLLFGLSMLLCVPPGPTQYIFHTPMTQYSLFVLKVSLNTNKPNLNTVKYRQWQCCFVNDYRGVYITETPTPFKWILNGSFITSRGQSEFWFFSSSRNCELQFRSKFQQRQYAPARRSFQNFVCVKFLWVKKIRSKNLYIFLRFSRKRCGILAFHLHWFMEIRGSTEWLQKVRGFPRNFSARGRQNFS